MKVYLMRHGAYATSDLTQPLTPQGASDVKRMAEYLKGRGDCIEEIWHSPKTRAAETAQIMAEVLACKNVAEKECLSPNSDPVQAIEDLGITDHNVAIVSHLPFIPHLIEKIMPERKASSLTIPTASILLAEKGLGEWKLCEVIQNGSA